ncbi:uncharacterized protein BDW70DRAFT_121483 [Aspergillus foveolatus]|uniref:uncharacterized protein n=1 Tax=Aspergillus foveolatus TaxID=210207 RepID=UPI003CCD2762
MASFEVAGVLCLKALRQALGLTGALRNPSQQPVVGQNGRMHLGPIPKAPISNLRPRQSRTPCDRVVIGRHAASARVGPSSLSPSSPLYLVHRPPSILFRSFSLDSHGFDPEQRSSTLVTLPFSFATAIRSLVRVSSSISNQVVHSYSACIR